MASVPIVLNTYWSLLITGISCSMYNKILVLQVISKLMNFLYFRCFDRTSPLCARMDSYPPRVTADQSARMALGTGIKNEEGGALRGRGLEYRKHFKWHYLFPESQNKRLKDALVPCHQTSATVYSILLLFVLFLLKKQKKHQSLTTKLLEKNERRQALTIQYFMNY